MANLLLQSLNAGVWCMKDLTQINSLTTKSLNWQLVETQNHARLKLQFSWYEHLTSRQKALVSVCSNSHTWEFISLAFLVHMSFMLLAFLYNIVWNTATQTGASKTGVNDLEIKANPGSGVNLKPYLEKTTLDKDDFSFFFSLLLLLRQGL